MLDVRPREAFLRGHARLAVSIPLEELSSRGHELPRERNAPLRVFDRDPKRLAGALAWLRKLGYRNVESVAVADYDRLPRAQAGCLPPPRLWSPNRWLERCWPKIEQALRPRLESARARALDLACGSGRDAVWLAERGLDVLAIDHLCDALARAQALAARHGVRLTTRNVDLERSEPGAEVLQPGGFDLITCFYFLWRPLFPVMIEALRPGGLICMQTFDVAERARSGRPRRERFLLQPGELFAAFAPLRLLARERAPDARGRLCQALLAQKPGAC